MSASKFFRNFLTLPQVGGKDNGNHQIREKDRENHDPKLQETQVSSFPAQDVECKREIQFPVSVNHGYDQFPVSDNHGYDHFPVNIDHGSDQFPVNIDHGSDQFPVSIDHGSDQHKKKVSDDTFATDPNEILNHENNTRDLQLNLQRAATANAKNIDRNCFGTDKSIDTIANNGPTCSEGRDEEIKNENNIRDLQLNLHGAAIATAEDIDRNCFDTEKGILEQVNIVTNHGPTCSEGRDEEIKNESTAEYVMSSFPNTEIHTDVVEFTNQQMTVDGSLTDEKTEEEVMAPTDVFDQMFQDYVNTLNVAPEPNDLEEAISDAECGSVASSANTEIYGDADIQDVEEPTHREETRQDVVITDVSDFVPLPAAHSQVPIQVDNLPFPLEGNKNGRSGDSSIAKKKKRILVPSGIVYDDEDSSPEVSISSAVKQTLLALNYTEQAKEVPPSSSSLCGNGNRGISSAVLSHVDPPAFSQVPPGPDLVGNRCVFATKDKDKPFGCKMCGETFEQKSYVFRHINRRHVVKQLFYCESCGKSFGNPHHLSWHLKICSLDKPFFCYHCEVRFSLKSDLCRHNLTHAEESSNFSCYICKKTFETRDAFVSHGNIHHKEGELSKIIACTICKIELPNFSAWVLHRMSHSSQKSHTSEQEMEVSSLESSQRSNPTHCTAPVDQLSVNSGHVKFNLPMQLEDSPVQDAFSLAPESSRSSPTTQSDSQLNCSKSEPQRSVVNRIEPVSKAPSVRELLISNDTIAKSNQSQDASSRLVSLPNGSSGNTHSKVVSMSKVAIVRQPQISNATKTTNQSEGRSNSSTSVNGKRISVATGIVCENKGSQIQTLPSTCRSDNPRVIPSSSYFPPSVNNYSSTSSFVNCAPQPMVFFTLPPGATIVNNPGIFLVQNNERSFATQTLLPFDPSAKPTINIPSSSYLSGFGGPCISFSSSNGTNPLPKLLPRAPVVSDRDIFPTKDMGTPHTCASCGKTYNKTNSLPVNKRQDLSSDCCDLCRNKLTRTEENQLFPCNICNKLLKTRDELVSHSKAHLDTVYKKRTVCKKVFRYPARHQRHMVIHAGEISSTSEQVIEVSSDESSQSSLPTQAPLPSNGSEVAKEVPPAFTTQTTNLNQGTSTGFYFDKEPPAKPTIKISSWSSLSGIGGLGISFSSSNGTNPLPKLLPRAPVVSDRGIFPTKDMGTPNTCASCGNTYNKTNSLLVNKRQNASSDCCDLCRNQLTHIEENQLFRCNICNESLKTSDELVSHSKAHKDEAYRQSTVCKICKMVFSYPTGLQRHMVIHAGEISSTSEQVVEVSSDESSQSSDESSQSSLPTQAPLTSNGSEVAKEVPPAFTSQTTNRDQRTSTRFYFNKEPPATSNLPPGATLLNDRGIYGINDKERPFACRFCGKSYKGKKAVYAHIRIQHDEKRFSCEFCGKRFAEPSHLANHVTMHTQEKPFACDLCGMRFRLRGSFRNHRYTHSEERQFSCKVCGKTFKTTNVLSRHMESHIDGPRKGVNCDICKKKYRTPSNLKEHMRIHTGEKPYKCTLCAKQFRIKPQLDIHMNSHSGKKRLAPCCTVCGKTVWESYMPIHMRMHTGEKPYECSICLKRFPKKTNLEGHMRSHTGEKPFACTGCDKRFALYSNMMTHKAKCTKIPENVA